MFFVFEIETTDPTGTHQIDAAVMVILHGLKPGNSKWINLTINGEDRFGRWNPVEEALTLDRGVVVRFDQHVVKLLDKFTTEELPVAATAALEALHNGGPECAVEMCDVCGMFVPYRAIEVKTICTCARCRKKFHTRVDPGDDGPAF